MDVRTSTYTKSIGLLALCLALYAVFICGVVEATRSLEPWVGGTTVITATVVGGMLSIGTYNDLSRAMFPWKRTS